MKDSSQRRKIDVESGPDIDLGFNENVSTMLLENRVDNSEAKAHCLLGASFLGGNLHLHYQVQYRDDAR